MFETIVANLMGLVLFILEVYMWIIMGRVIISWVSADPYNPIVRFIYEVTEPVLGRIRRVIPLNIGGLDFSPIILIVGITIVKSILQNLLHQIY